MTSNQYATSFVIGDAFKSKYDQFGINRKVLSRSIEDYGTMIESLIPWTTTTIFMSATLQVSYADYWHWQLLSLFNIIIAPTFAILGIGCFYGKGHKHSK
jgi:NhaC family Na+:H+ antiporter